MPLVKSHLFYTLITGRVLEKDWLPPAEKKKFEERLTTLQNQKTRLEFRSSALNRSINNMLIELGSLKDTLQPHEAAELTTLLEAFNVLISQPVEPQSKE